MNLRNLVIWGVIVVVLIGLYSMMATSITPQMTRLRMFITKPIPGQRRASL